MNENQTDIKLLPILAKGLFIKSSHVPNAECYRWYHEQQYIIACNFYLQMISFFNTTYDTLFYNQFDKDLIISSVWRNLNKVR